MFGEFGATGITFRDVAEMTLAQLVFLVRRGKPNTKAVRKLGESRRSK